jgi:peptide deformylase
MTILPILIHPHPVLRQKAEKVGDITPEILKLLDDMLETMYAAPGIGLAAPQIGVSKRIVVMDVAGEDVGKKRNPMKLINPEIIAVSEMKTTLDEGCLSLPEMRVEVSRPEIVTVRYKDEKGTEHTIEATDLLAKCFQHEIDHLDGKLIFDYLSPLKRDMALRKYNKNLKLAGE